MGTEDSQRPLRLLSLGKFLEPNKTYECLCCVDGGGIRGLSSLYILRSIMAAVQSKSNNPGGGPIRPCEHFDLIAGTSTGG